MWDDIHDGMYRVVQIHSQFDGLGVDVAGKTGTAEINIYHPNHGMFVGYAPASDPEYAIAVRIENGYTSGNACLAADDIFKYIFELTDEKSILPVLRQVIPVIFRMTETTIQENTRRMEIFSGRKL